MRTATGYRAWFLGTIRLAVMKVCLPKHRPWVEAFLGELAAIGPVLSKLRWMVGLSGILAFAVKERLSIAVAAKARPALLAALTGTVITGLVAELGRREAEAEVLNDIFLPIALLLGAMSLFILGLMLLTPRWRNSTSLS